MTHVADIQVTGLPVKTETPGIAQSIRPDFRPAASISKGIVCWDAVRIGIIHIDPQQLAQQCVHRLAVAVWVSPGSAVTKAQVEKTIRSKSQTASIVIGIWLVYPQQDMLAGRVSCVLGRVCGKA